MINTLKLHKELDAAGIPLHGVSSNGRIDFKEEATQEQKDAAQIILDNHDAKDSYDVLREKDYSSQISSSAFQEAYFEKYYEEDSTKMDALQAIRVQIKTDIPKT